MTTAFPGVRRSVREGFRARALSQFVVLLWCALAASAEAQTPTPLPRFDVDLTTTRGCLETGQNPVYAVGDSITVFFRIGSSSVSQATVTLFDILPTGNVGVFSFGQLATNRTFAFGAVVAPPLGVEQLRLRASAPGVLTTRRSCSFVVVAAAPTPGASMTPSATPTPAATATPTPSPAVTATATPGAVLSPQITTNRGCLENKDNAVFTIGDSIVVSLQVDSPTFSFAAASVLDILPNGFVNVFSFGFVPTNVPLSFAGRITPPSGVEALQLRARVSGIQATSGACSFLVLAAPTATATSMIPATPTATATATATP